LLLEQGADVNESVSVIIPNLNSPTIDRTIASLHAQTRADAIAEIIVVGRDEPGRLPDDPLVRFVDTHQPVTAPVARNRGIALAQANVLIFIDADCIADSKWLEHLLQTLNTGKDVVSGAMALVRDTYWAVAYNISWFHDFLPSAPAGARRHLPTSNLLVRRQVIETVGLLDEELARGQDTDWTARMVEHGYQLWFAPQAIVYHHHARRTAHSIWQQCRQGGAYAAQVRLYHPGVLAAPGILRRPRLLTWFSPLIAALVSAQIFVRDRALWPYLPYFPAVYMTKIAWCLGAANPPLRIAAPLTGKARR
jgi:GT2 family glycosyltransferase